MKRYLLFLLSCLFCFNIHAYAASSQVESIVYFSVKTMNTPGPGQVREAEVSAGYNAEIESLEWSREYTDWTPGTKLTLTAKVVPSREGSRFQSSKTKVYVSGCDLVSSSVHNNYITIKANYVPQLQLEAPGGLYMDGDTACWDKVSYAKAYEIGIRGAYYKTIKVTTNKCNLAQYLTDEENTLSWAVRAVPNDNQSSYLHAGEWTEFGETLTADEDNTAYGVWEGSGNRLRFRLEKDEDGYAYYATGWENLGNAWYYFDPDRNGYAHTGWLQQGAVWYYLDPNTCMMQRGWQKIDNVWYYFYSDGVMATGWIQDGPTSPWYYLDSSGAMLHDTFTPDGYYVNSDGAWTGQTAS